MSGRPDPVGAAGQVEAQVDGRREAVLPGVVDQVGVGRRQELGRLDRRHQAAHGSGQQQGPGAGPVTLAGDVDHRDVEASGLDVAHDEEVAGEARAPRRADHRLGVPRARQVGQHPLTLDPVAELGQHRLPHAAGDAEPRPAERRQHEDEGEQEDHHDGEHDAAVEGRHLRQSEGQQHHVVDHEPRQRPGPEEQAAHHQRQDDGRDRHQRRGTPASRRPRASPGGTARPASAAPAASRRGTSPHAAEHGRGRDVVRWMVRSSGPVLLCRDHCRARDRNLRWHWGHQKMLRPTSTSVRTVDPHTRHG